jgi:cell division protein FtsB
MATDTIQRTPRQPAPRRAYPVTAPRHTRPVPPPGTRPAPRPAGPRSRSRAPRMPFILLLVGLLGGALISLLVISTTLAQGSFRITSLQAQNAELARQAQTLTNQVAQAGSPAVIAKKARQLGMRPNPRLGFIDLKSGKIVVGKPSRADAAINVPGFNP